MCRPAARAQKDVDAAVPVGHRADHGLDLHLVGDIQPVRLAAPDLPRDRTGRIRIDVAHGHVRAGLGECVRRRPADAVSAAGDQRDPAVQPR
jgi:hypothetical protein